MLKDFLVAPGPTPVPSEVLLEMAMPVYHHRTPRFSRVFRETLELLQYVYQTRNDVFILASSGTGAMESAVVNTLSAGDRVIVIRGGKFGERWGEIAEAYGVLPIYIDVEWGQTASPQQVEALLKENPDVKAVFTQYSETSTGVVYDIKGISEVVNRTEALMVVDGITGLGVSPCPTDDWGIDILVCGSQKSLMLPPGLGFLSFSEKAWKAYESSSLPKFYFNLKAEKKAQANDTTAWTPATTLIIGLHKALSMVKEEGLENVHKRHAFIAEAVRSGVQSLGLELFASPPADSVTSVKVPEGIDGGKIPKLMRDKYGVAIAGGQAHVKGKIFRIGHLGYIDKTDLAVVFQALEFSLAELGHKFEWGVSQKAIQEKLYAEYKNYPIR
ncbi:MAG: alanine--glyoxylate aminotransferase family protein [Spirochaetota bacterium]|nr:alanine--glyoxylate aminotransferase family protein [Spirochaetota bacterium]